MTEHEDDDAGEGKRDGAPADTTSSRAAPGDDAPRDTTDDLEAGSIRALIRKSSRMEDEVPDLVAGFQRKLRKRSGGKFYADGWSTSKEPPIMTYLITSLLMLAMVFAAYAVLRPLAGESISVPMTPAPVRVLPPPRP
ncbi:MAG TPA: hypothetical protein VFU02_11420 [Polyangiaceae bacterium]|nr:hypothetical protein [Polyangiaceae bacterium]